MVASRARRETRGGIFFNERKNISLFANGNDPEERGKLIV